MAASKLTSENCFKYQMLCTKVILVLLKYEEGKELTGVDKNTLLRSGKLILNKIVKGAKICEGKEMYDYSDGFEGVSLYGYALQVCKKIYYEDNPCFYPTEELGTVSFFEGLLKTISDMAVGNQMPSIDSVLFVKRFFKLFGNHLRTITRSKSLF